jgi:hypothetical protein
VAKVKEEGDEKYQLMLERKDEEIEHLREQVEQMRDARDEIASASDAKETGANQQRQASTASLLAAGALASGNRAREFGPLPSRGGRWARRGRSALAWAHLKAWLRETWLQQALFAVLAVPLLWVFRGLNITALEILRKGFLDICSTMGTCGRF